ncbi:hypothetical protein BKA62DRAFT_486961 [Auriculariales sp. MPI-PUGE-AT-0066]|nr:hypothetical protein BKA62DRAFT_486961 [Auriculariales sp. MPI-PUGE-AT-0066]
MQGVKRHVNISRSHKIETCSLSFYRAPSLELVNRTCCNMDVALQQRSSDISSLTARWCRLSAAKLAPPATRRPMRKLQTLHSLRKARPSNFGIFLTSLALRQWPRRLATRRSDRSLDIPIHVPIRTHPRVHDHRHPRDVAPDIRLVPPCVTFGTRVFPQ